jgi:hypothetical protein
MKGPSLRSHPPSLGGGGRGGGGGAPQEATTTPININPSAPENLQKLQASIDVVMATPKRQYQLEWKRELDAYIKEFGIPPLHREVPTTRHAVCVCCVVC